MIKPSFILEAPNKFSWAILIFIVIFDVIFQLCK